MDLARYIEHSNLSPTLTIGEIDQLVEEARHHNFFGICVPPFWVKRARREIGDTPITLSTVAGFPFGYNMTETKLDEIKRAIENGADEIEVVWNLTSFKTGIPWTKVEIAKCSRLVHDYQKVLKVIIETPCLSDKEIVEACILCSDAGTDFVKSSTGIGDAVVQEAQIKLMRKVLPEAVGIQACGNVNSHQHAIQLIVAGADRIGTSSSVKIVESTNQPIHYE